jgi:hypothetical protein
MLCPEGPSPDGPSALTASFRSKDKYCSGSWAWGGYDYSAKHSAFNADFYAAYIRSCLDNDFYDGGSWLYGGRTIAQIIATNGFDYAVWGCVGSWFSGDHGSDGQSDPTVHELPLLPK